MAELRKQSGSSLGRADRNRKTGGSSSGTNGRGSGRQTGARTASQTGGSRQRTGRMSTVRGSVPGAREKSRSNAGSTIPTGRVKGARTAKYEKDLANGRGATSTASRRDERRYVEEMMRKNRRSSDRSDYDYSDEQQSVNKGVCLVIVGLISILCFLSYIGACGSFGVYVNKIVFGFFGAFAYVLPFAVIGVAIASAFSKDFRMTGGRIAASVFFVIFLTALIQLAVGGYNPELKLLDNFTNSAPDFVGTPRAYGGLFGGIICNLLCGALGKVGTVCVLVALLLIMLILVTGRAVFAAISEYRQNREERREEQREQGYEDDDILLDESFPFDEHRKRRRIRLQSPVVIERVSDEDDELDALLKESEKTDSIDFVDSLRMRGSMLVPDKEEKEQKKSEEIKKAAIELEEISSGSRQPDPEKESDDLLDADAYYKQELRRKYGGREKIDMPELRRSKYADSIVIGKTDGNGYFIDDPEAADSLAGEPSKDNGSFFEDYSGVDEEFGEEFSGELEEEGFSCESYEDTFEAVNCLDAATEQIKDNIVDFKSKAFETDFDSFEPAHETKQRTISEADSSAASDIETKKQEKAEAQAKAVSETEELQISEPEIKKYVFPPIDLLKKSKGGSKTTSDSELMDTARKLEETFQSFGVGVTVTDVSCGPSVTRYELHPEQGVKVSRITALADDIKLNLAAADIRIEAPIPGKAAVGIEIPNKENTIVLLRDLIETKEFETHKSNIAFAVGKDIAGKTVVTDIAKMPHLLIAGATGSGKSVCINTLIMSIIYKASPEDVKLIMVDPKVVELNVYNGIPHLLIPVVTDPKKASAALNWAVMEMTNRYKMFADAGVRDLVGYNQKVDEELLKERPEGEPTVLLTRLPQIVIIVDELADLMMVAPGEVEDAICRLAQLARAAGIHLVIATQRPSVNVITGLIKANVPSRIAFAVSSAIDSRTIIDGSGAEKLLGRGDMLFFPSGFPKPVRLQGAFVSDSEVANVVEFLKNQQLSESGAADEIERHMEAAQLESCKPQAAAGDGNDEYFAEAGRFIIEKEKASIGLLQRVYKIGFNRAARIMDQLAEAGVVGPEEGTKPRKILMTMEEFEQFLSQQT